MGLTGQGRGVTVDRGNSRRVTVDRDRVDRGNIRNIDQPLPRLHLGIYTLFVRLAKRLPQEYIDEDEDGDVDSADEDEDDDEDEDEYDALCLVKLGNLKRYKIHARFGQSWQTLHDEGVRQLESVVKDRAAEKVKISRRQALQTMAIQRGEERRQRAVASVRELLASSN